MVRRIKRGLVYKIGKYKGGEGGYTSPDVHPSRTSLHFTGPQNIRNFFARIDKKRRRKKKRFFAFSRSAPSAILAVEISEITVYSAIVEHPLRVLNFVEATKKFKMKVYVLFTIGSTRRVFLLIFVTFCTALIFLSTFLGNSLFCFVFFRACAIC